LAKVRLDGFVYTSVRDLRGLSHIFLHVQVTLTDGVRLMSQHPAMFRLATAARPLVELFLRSPQRHPPTQHDDERTLSISANGAYYLYVLGCARSVWLFSVSIQARGGVVVPSPEKHR
jgi:hypothetical protein